MKTNIKRETKETDNHQNYNKKNNNKKNRKSRKIEKQEDQKKLKTLSKTSKYSSRCPKSKIDTLDEAIDDNNANLICLVERHQAKEKKIGIPGYRIYTNDGTKNSKGILIVVKNNFKIISVEVNRYDEVGQTLWILLNNQRQKIRTGAIYRPQKNMTSNNELKLLYKTISEQIEIAKGKYQQVLMVGNFNVKIGNHIPGNKETLSKGQKQLKRIMEKYNLNIINTSEIK